MAGCFFSELQKDMNGENTYYIIVLEATIGSRQEQEGRGKGQTVDHSYGEGRTQEIIHRKDLSIIT